jgi:hypothetical protein
MRRSKLIWPTTSTKIGPLDSARAGLARQDSLGTGKWQIMPGLGVRYSFADLGPDTYFVPVIRYALSVAGGPARRNIRQAQISPKLNIGLSERWFVTLYPSYDVRINYGPSVPGQTGRSSSRSMSP